MPQMIIDSVIDGTAMLFSPETGDRLAVHTEYLPSGLTVGDRLEMTFLPDANINDLMRQIEEIYGSNGIVEVGLSFHRLKEENRRRCEESFHPTHDWSPSDWATALAGEVGEACNLIKKMRRGEEIPIEEIGYEIADAVIYADLLCTRLGISLETAIRSKFNLVSERVNSPRKL